MNQVIHKNLNDFADYIAVHFSRQDILERKIENDELTLSVLKSELLEVLEFLRDDPACKFNCLLDVTAADLQVSPNRFVVVYHLLSTVFERCIRLKIYTDLDLPVVSASAVYPAANWYEREVWDMFGIAFSNHDDLRRILTDESFRGEPLKKDFPVEGEKKLRRDLKTGEFYYEPVNSEKDLNLSKVTELGG